MPYYAVKKGRNPGVYYDWYALLFCMLFFKREMLLDAKARQYSLRIVLFCNVDVNFIFVFFRFRMLMSKLNRLIRQKDDRSMFYVCSQKSKVILLDRKVTLQLKMLCCLEGVCVCVCVEGWVGTLWGLCAVRPCGKVGDLGSFTSLELEDMGFGVLVCIVKAGLANKQQQQQKAPKKKKNNNIFYAK